MSSSHPTNTDPEHDDNDNESDQEDQGWDDWNEEEDEETTNENNNNNSTHQFKCLFCHLTFTSCTSLFDHCAANHKFDFFGLKKSLELDFYGCFKLINYIRVMVSRNICWSCGYQCMSNEELQDHLHEVSNLKELKHLWDDDKYLQPFMQEDSLLYSFDEEEDSEEDDERLRSVDEEEFKRLCEVVGDVNIKDEVMADVFASTSSASSADVARESASSPSNGSQIGNLSRKVHGNGVGVKLGATDIIKIDASMRVSSEIRKVNEGYFGAYSSFGIHREMLSDKVRMDAYGQAILKNPSLFKGANVLDVGCGTGILSLFAARAGASRVIAVDASEKMTIVATQIAKENGCLRSGTKGDEQQNGVIEVVHGMVEDLGKSLQIEPHSLDVLLSEWMGYCLLYESMLTSVLFARDRWLKPGGAILPDTATMFAAGFGRGGTSLPFWENVYGFTMSCVGKELVGEAAKFPIVDVIDSRDIVTETAVLQTFDLATMRVEDMDFTSCIELQTKLDIGDIKSGLTWCHGVVLWFDTGFTSRFCRETPSNLSTSPYTLKTHWSQTILTFKEPIALSSESISGDGMVGTDTCPASKIQLRVSVVRASLHRAIDISIETSGVSRNGRKRCWPAQIFNLS